MVMYIYNPSTQEAESGASHAQSQPELQNEFQANLSCTERSCLKKKQTH
jgi:hypothetical protein